MTNWSTQQQAIFEWFEKGSGHLCVRARAGTGKTTTIIEGVNRAPEAKILVCAFNKRIATELSKRLTNPRAEAKTLHGVGFGIIRMKRKKVTVDGDRGERLAKQACGDDVPFEIVKLVNKVTSRAKNTCPFATQADLVSEAQDIDAIPDDNFEREGYTVDFVAAKALIAMELAVQDDGTIDFDDMVYLPVKMKWAWGRWDLVVIDEAQDSSYTNLLLAQQSCKKNGRIAVVGDDRQAIYGFRGADSGSLDRLKKAYKAKELGLTITYRCPKNVVELAAQIVSDFECAPGTPDGTIETLTMAKCIERAQPDDFILSRANAPLASACLALLRVGKRARVEGRDVGLGLITLVKKLKAKSIANFIEKLGKWRDSELTKAQKLPESKRDAKCELINDKHETLVALTEDIEDVTSLVKRIEMLFADVAETGVSYIVCSTVHKAKGLERHNVFLLENTFKRRGAREEDNIRYVAITRAKKCLFWVQSPETDGDLYPQGVKSKSLERDVKLELLNGLSDDQAVEFIKLNSPKSLIS